MKTILDELEHSIRAALDDTPFWQQASLFEIEAERDQLRKDHEALKQRLDSIPATREQETAALRRRYADPQARWFPAAITFLVPASIAHAGSARWLPVRRAPARPPRPLGGPGGRVEARATGTRQPNRCRRATSCRLGRRCSGPTARSSPSRCSPRHSRRAWTRSRPDTAASSARLARGAGEAPDLLTPAWDDLVLTDLLGYTPPGPRRGGALPAELRAGPSAAAGFGPTPIAHGPDGQGRPGRAAADLPDARRDAADHGVPGPAVGRRAGRGAVPPPGHARWPCSPTAPCGCSCTPSPASRHRPPSSTPTCGWRNATCCGPSPACSARAGVLPPPKNADGTPTAPAWRRCSPAAPRRRPKSPPPWASRSGRPSSCWSASCRRLDRESGGALLGEVAPRQVYRGTLTVMMRLVFLLYAEEQRLLPVSSDLYATAYSVTSLHAPARRRAEPATATRSATAAPPPGPACSPPSPPCTKAASTPTCASRPTAAACSTPRRYPWLEGSPSPTGSSTRSSAPCSSCERRGGAAERLSYKGLDVEQIGHVYEGLLEFSCLRVDEPYLGLIGKLEPEIRLGQVEQAAEDDDLLRVAGQDLRRQPGERCARRWAISPHARDLATSTRPATTTPTWPQRVRPLRGLLRRDLRGLPTVFPAGSLVIHPGRRPPRHRHPLHPAQARRGDRRAHPRAPRTTRPAPPTAPSRRLAGPSRRRAAQAQGARPGHGLRARSWSPPAATSPTASSTRGNVTATREVRAGCARVPTSTAMPRPWTPGACVAARCLYGVDRDEAAVELGKLSLWLVTLAKDQPFSFLDHALRCGDSLVGLISESQVVGLPPRPRASRTLNNARLAGAIDEIATPS